MHLAFDDNFVVERLRGDVGVTATPTAAQITKVRKGQVTAAASVLVEAGERLVAELLKEYLHRSLLVQLGLKVE
jgi:hypothetical protein